MTRTGAPETGTIRRTKIVCTLGPATADPQRLWELAEAGMDVARLNFSHGSHAWHVERFRDLRRLADNAGRPIAILQDLSGPKLRVGELPTQGIRLQLDEVWTLTPTASARAAGTIPVPVPPLLAALRPGQRVSFDDGQIDLLVEEVRPDGVACRVIHGGVLLGRKGIAAPGAGAAIHALTSRDLDDLALGLSLGVDWIAVSFVRQAEDLAPVREAISRAGADAGIIAKIEKPEAVAGIGEILEASDGLMIARGDLGVEMPLFDVPILQKELIRRCYRSGKPVITATQMLESMTHSPHPTRAEVSDVANAILDGTSAVMLSAETAIGDYPVEAVRAMAEIAVRTEQHLDYQQWLHQGLDERATNVTDAISQGVAEIAHDLGAAAILCSTTSGHTARMVSRMRPRMPIIAATPRESTYRRLALSWGVRPLLVPETQDTDRRLAAAVEGALGAGWIQRGDTVVITLGAPMGTPGRTSLIKVQQV